MGDIPFPHLRTSHRFTIEVIGISCNLQDKDFFIQTMDLWCFKNGKPKRVVTNDLSGLIKEWAKTREIPCIVLLSSNSDDRILEILYKRDGRLLTFSDKEESWSIARKADMLGIRYEIYQKGVKR